MAFLIIGILLLILKFAEIGPVAGWSWVWVLLPFGLAAAWWAFADSTGITQKRAVRKMEERKVARRERDMKALGLDVHRERRVRILREPGARSKGKADAPPADKGRS